MYPLSIRNVSLTQALPALTALEKNREVTFFSKVVREIKSGRGPGFEATGSKIFLQGCEI